MSVDQVDADFGRGALPGGMRRLPSGRHRLSPEEVLTSQRGRLLFAAFDAVADKGYAATTIADIVTRAGVSRRTFYEHFPSKLACFLAATDASMEIFIGAMGEAGQALAEGDWRGRVEASLRTYLALGKAQPSMARVWHIELVSADPDIAELRMRAMSRLAERMREAHRIARAQDPGLPELGDEMFQLLVGGIDEMIRRCVLTRDTDALPELHQLVVEATLAIFGVRAH